MDMPNVWTLRPYYWTHNYYVDLINAVNASSFYFEGNSFDWIYGVKVGFNLANSNGTIAGNAFYMITGAASCNPDGLYGILKYSILPVTHLADIIVAGYGESIDNPALSCNDLVRKRGPMPDGVYYMFYSPYYNPQAVYCDFTSYPGRGIYALLPYMY